MEVEPRRITVNSGCHPGTFPNTSFRYVNVTRLGHQDFFYFLEHAPMAITREQKAVLMEELSTGFSEAKSVVFAQNNGLAVHELEALRTELRAANIKLKIAKKRIMRIAAKNSANVEIDPSDVEGPIAAAFAYGDEVSVFKILSTFAKKHEKLVLVSGLFEGKVVNQSMVTALADIPSREELLAKLVGTMNAPISGFHGVLHGVLRNFVGVCDAIREKKQTA